jgi:hypothetical protein
MWGGILKKVALLGWLIERICSDIALKTLHPMAAAVSKAREVSEAPVVSKATAVSGVKGDGGVGVEGSSNSGNLEGGSGDRGDGDDDRDSSGDLLGEVGGNVGGEMVRCQFWSSTWSLRSSSSQRRFRVFFAGGGAVGEVVLGGDVGEEGRCGRAVGVAVIGLVWVLVELEAGFP